MAFVSKKKRSNDLEHKVQVSIMQWSVKNRKVYPFLEMLYAVPNGGQRSRTTGLKLKLEGVKAGIWDLSLDAPTGSFHGLKIEVKRPGGKMSDKQNDWGDKYKDYGYALAVVDSVKDFASAISIYSHSVLGSTSDILKECKYIVFSDSVKNRR